MLGNILRAGLVAAVALIPIFLSILEYHKAFKLSSDIFFSSVLVVLAIAIALVVRLIVVPFQYGFRTLIRFLRPVAMLAGIAVAVYFWSDISDLVDRIFFWFNQAQFERTVIGSDVVYWKGGLNPSLFFHDGSGKITSGWLSEDQHKAIAHAIGEYENCRRMYAMHLSGDFFILKPGC